MAPEIPTYLAQRRGISESGAVRANNIEALTNTGAKEAYIAMGEASQTAAKAITGLAMAHQDAMDQADFTAGKALYETAENQLAEDLGKDQDFASYPQKLTAWKKNTSTQIISGARSNRAKSALQDYITLKNTETEKFVSSLKTTKEIDDGAAKVLWAADQHAQNGSFALAEAAIIQGTNRGFFSQERTVSLRKGIEQEAMRYRQQQLETGLFDKGSKIYQTQGPDAAYDYIWSQEGIDAGTRTKVANDIESFVNRKNNVAKIQQDQIDAQDSVTVYNKVYLADQPDLTIIDNSRLSPDKKVEWRNKVSAELDRRARGFDSPTDFQTRNQISDLIGQIKFGAATKQEGRDAILAARDNHKLSRDDVKELSKLIDTDYSSYVNSGVESARAYGKNQILSRSPLTGAIMGNELQEYRLSLFDRDLNNWIVKQIRDQKEPTPEAIQAQAEQLVAVHKVPENQLLIENKKYLDGLAQQKQKAVLLLEQQTNPQAIPKRLPGETLADYMKRTGAK